MKVKICYIFKIFVLDLNVYIIYYANRVGCKLEIVHNQEMQMQIKWKTHIRMLEEL